MAIVRDPVCGMDVDPATAAGRSTYRGHTYYFCSAACQERFDDAPAHFASEQSVARPADAERARAAKPAEPPFTTRGGVTAPKFGSAGSGGLEYEPRPHDEPPDA